MRTPTSISQLSQLFKLALSEWRLLLCGLVGLTLGSAVNLLLPEAVRQALGGGADLFSSSPSSGLPHNTTPSSLLALTPTLTAGIFVGLFAIQAVFFYLRSYCFYVIGQRVAARLRVDLYSALITREVSFFDSVRTGDLLSRLSNDVSLIQDVVSMRISIFVRYSLQVVIGLMLMFWLSPALTGMLVLIVPLLVGVALFLGRILKKATAAQQSELAFSTAVAEETLGSARIVRAFNREAFEITRFQHSTEKVQKLGESRATVSAFFQSFVSFLLNIALVGVVVVGVSAVQLGTISAADLTAFLMYGVIVAVSFAFVSSTIAEIAQGLGASERVFSLLATRTPPIFRPGNPITVSANSTIEFRGVEFSYPARPEVVVLSEINFSLSPHTMTALVGPSGAGKSSVVALLLGWYPPSGGTILLDGTPLAPEQLHVLREYIAYVPQEPTLFAVSIEENIRYGKLTASEEEIRAVCAQARILEFIESLPQGFQTAVGSRGVQLSGGQKQRIAIARALLRNPKFLLLDEATSSLDSDNEQAIYEALQDVFSQVTTLVIAHRLSTINMASIILVFNQGRIVERGTHEQLSAQNGLYSLLVAQQRIAA